MRRLVGLSRLAVEVVEDMKGVVRDARTTDRSEVLGETRRLPASALDIPAGGPPSRVLDVVEATLNGIWGDRLVRRRNPLAVEMGLRHEGRSLPLNAASLASALECPTGRVVVFVHGWSCTEAVWRYAAMEHYGNPSTTFGGLLRRDLGYTPLYVRYNTGRHVSENGRDLSQLLADLVEAYPVAIERMVLVGHSMGGLVVRSAAHYGDEAQATWVRALRHVFCLGSPHLGALLEQGTHLFTSLLGSVSTVVTQTSAGILNTRSNGIKDLRFGYTRDEEWRDRDPDAFFEDHRGEAHLVEGVGYHFVGATIAKTPEEPWGRLVGDIFVRAPSAAGQAREPTRRVPFRSGRILGGMSHFQLASHPDVYAVLRSALTASLQGGDLEGSVGG